METLFSAQREEEEVNFADSVNYEVVTSQEALEASVEELLQEGILGVDTENTAIDPYLGNPLILQIGTSSKCFVYPSFIGLDFSPLKRILENEKILKIFFNAHYDYKWIYVKYGISIVNLFCCQVAERLLTVGKPNAFRRPNLRGVAEKYLGITIKKEVRNNFIHRDPIERPITQEEYAYSAADVVILPDIYFQQALLLEQDKLLDASALESEVLPVFAEMEIHGSLVDKDKWRKLLVEAARRREDLAKKLYTAIDPVVAQKNMFGLPSFNLNSTEQLIGHLNKLMAHLKVKDSNKRTLKLESTEEDVLKKFKKYHPIFGLLIDYRGYQKVTSTYGEEFLEKIHPVTGRIHAKFNQLQADTGRASSSDPNLQNILGFDEDDPESLNFRSCFVARPGYKLITADFSQQELRILADLSGDPVLSKAYLVKDENGNDMDIHRYTASVVFGIPYEKVGKKSRERRISKTLNFLLVYGGGARSLAEDLEISEDEAQKIIDDYFERYPGIKRALDRWANQAINNQFVTTVSGRRRYMPLPPQEHPDFEKIKASIKRKAKNNPMQGGGADVTKMAMVKVHRAIKRAGYDARILKVVHDELVVEAREDQAEEVAKLVESEMVAGFTHYFKKIPMRVDAGISDSWEK